MFLSYDEFDLQQTWVTSGSWLQKGHTHAWSKLDGFQEIIK